MTELELKTKKERLCVIKEMESVKENRASMSLLNNVNRLFNFGTFVSAVTLAGTIPAGVYSDAAYITTATTGLATAAICIPASFVTLGLLISRRKNQIKYEQSFIEKFGDQYDVTLSKTRYYPTNINKMNKVTTLNTIGVAVCMSGSIYACALAPGAFIVSSVFALVGGILFLKGNAKTGLIFTGETSRMMQNLKNRRIKEEISLLNDSRYTVEAREIAEKAAEEKLNDLDKEKEINKTETEVDKKEDVVKKPKKDKQLEITDLDIPDLDIPDLDDKKADIPNVNLKEKLNSKRETISSGHPPLPPSIPCC